MDNLDPDFISFLYSERERENNLSQLQGWNNWALIGAFVTVLCAAYAILKEYSLVNWKDVLYYSGGIMAFFLNYNSWWRIFKRERGVDMSKVRMLKEVVPYVQIALVFVCSVLSLILIPILDEINFVFWMWLIMAVVYALALIVVVVCRNKIVSSFFKELMMPWVCINAVFYFVTGCLYGEIGLFSFRRVTCGWLSQEFVLASCVSACMVLIYIFLKINTGNKPVQRFDAIIDGYLYIGVSKEDTYNEILINRMGYGVFDVFSREQKEIEKLMETFDEDDTKIDEIKQQIKSKQCTVDEIADFLQLLKEISKKQTRINELSIRIVKRFEEIIRVAPRLKNLRELKRAINWEEANNHKIKVRSNKLNEVINLLESYIKGQKSKYNNGD